MTSSPSSYQLVRYLAPRAIVGAVIAAAVVAIISIIVGSFSDVSWRLLGTVVVFTVFAAMAWLDVLIAERRPGWFALLSFIADCYIFLAGIVTIWTNAGWAPPIVSWFWVAVVARVGLAHVDLVRFTSERLRARVIDAVSTAVYPLVAILVVGLTLPVFAPSWADSEAYWRVVGVVAVLDVLGTVLIPLVWMLFHRGAAHAEPPVHQAAWLPSDDALAAEAAAAQAAPTSAVSSPAAQGAPSSDPTPSAASSHQASIATSTFVPPAAAYVGMPGRRLAWPRYDDGTPLPVREDGSPDFRLVIGHPDNVG